MYFWLMFIAQRSAAKYGRHSLPQADTFGLRSLTPVHDRQMIITRKAAPQSRPLGRKKSSQIEMNYPMCFGEA